MPIKPIRPPTPGSIYRPHSLTPTVPPPSPPVRKTTSDSEVNDTPHISLWVWLTSPVPKVDPAALERLVSKGYETRKATYALAFGRDEQHATELLYHQAHKRRGLDSCGSQDSKPVPPATVATTHINSCNTSGNDDHSRPSFVAVPNPTGPSKTYPNCAVCQRKVAKEQSRLAALEGRAKKYMDAEEWEIRIFTITHDLLEADSRATRLEELRREMDTAKRRGDLDKFEMLVERIPFPRGPVHYDYDPKSGEILWEGESASV